MVDVSTDALPYASAGSRRFVLALFSAAIFLSAALLFWVEPLFSKMVLPVLGGTSSVWSVAMVVFQGLMLAGYVYAHLLTRYLNIRHALLVHVLVLATATLSLPIGIASGFQSPPLDGPSLWLVGLFLASIGLPFFALAANAPLLQAWFARSNTQNAYLLYRASNLGSFLVLLAYPVLIERFIGLADQSRLWSGFYLVLIVAILASGAMAMRLPAAPAPAHTHSIAADTSWRSRLSWVALGFIPSGLLIAVTAHIATDVASGPFIWIIPLALYLLTYVFAFSDNPALSAKTMLALQPFTTAMLVILFFWRVQIGWGLSLTGHLAAFFVAAMVCQSELYRRRPAQEQLTQFYAWMSLGGVLGGIFAALIAPRLFSTVLEYPLLVLASLLIRPNVWQTPRAIWVRDLALVAGVGLIFAAASMLLASATAIFVVAVMTMAPVMAFQGGRPARLVGFAALLLAATHLYDPTESVVARMRSFYGVYKVVDLPPGKYRALFHGTIVHGAEQIRGDDGKPFRGRPQPLTYYYIGGPFDEGIQAVRASAGGTLARVALVGQGVGSLTCERKPGEAWTIYELDPLVAAIARDPSLFRFMTVCAPDTEVVLGDGRLTLRAAKPGIDLLLLDTFSSDAVPLHMLTREAFALYKSRLGPHGVILMNISNRNMQLRDAVAASAAANGMVTAVKRDHRQVDSAHDLRFLSEIALVARSEADLQSLKLGPDWRAVRPSAGTKVWTDDYSNVLDAILANMRQPALPAKNPGR
jgi:hypothetical protein